MDGFFSQLCLGLVNPDKIEYVIVASYLTLRNKDVKLALALFIFTRLFSVILKEAFAIPLPNGNCTSYGFAGYAFPGGHVQISSIFYIWLFLSSKLNSVKITSVMIVVLGSIYEVIAGYHYPIDVVVAPFASLGLWAFFKKLRSSNEGKLFSIICMSLLMLSLIFMCDMTHYKNNNPYTFMVLYKVIGFCLGCICVQKFGIRRNILMTMTILGVVSVVTQTHEQACINQIEWIIIAAMLPIIKRVLDSIFSAIKFARNKTEDNVSYSMTIMQLKMR
ncbi:MAG: hypothetical protein LBJ92_04370 [Holosporales bacterium]|jgi:undecaprenyl-diphosphatase|nr:hypothetical protein [Holosporales bacterium]